MSLANFIPTIWSTKLLIELRKVLVFAQPFVINRDYEGEIKQFGDTVKISALGSITVGDYTKSSIGAPQVLTSAQTTLQITQSKFFNFMIDDADKAQMNVDMMAKAMEKAAYALKNTADTFVAGHYVDASADNLIGSTASPISMTKVTDAYDYLVDLAKKLDEADVPENGRWCAIPPWMEGLMLKDERFVGNGALSAEDRLVNGAISRVSGMLLMKTNACPLVGSSSDIHKVIAGHPYAWSYAEQVNEVEGFRPEEFFADAVKGLHLYGAKVTNPECLAVLSVKKGLQTAG
jgi:N4-gp56 family major capsid protein